MSSTPSESRYRIEAEAGARYGPALTLAADETRACRRLPVTRSFLGVERQPPLQPVVCRSPDCLDLPGSYADLATGFTTNRGALQVGHRNDAAVGINHPQAAQPLRGGQGRAGDARPGLTEDGAGQALGWPKARVTARVKVLELPERAQRLIGDGVIALSAVDQVRAIGAVAPELLDAVIAYLDDGNEWAAERLAREPGWVLDAALAHAGNGKVFAAYMHSAGSREIAELRLGKKAERLYAEAEKLHASSTADDDVDQARAAGVLIEFERGQPIIVDRSLYRELVKGAIKRTHAELDAKAAAAATDKKAARAGKRPADPLSVAKRERERDARLRELTDQAHGANVDLGVSLMHHLAAVEPDDMDVARFFVLCGRPDRTNYAERVTMPTQPVGGPPGARLGGLLDCASGRGIGIVSAPDSPLMTVRALLLREKGR